MKLVKMKNIELKRRDLKLKSRARVKSIRQKEGKWQQFLYGGVHWTPPVTVPLF